MPPYCESSYLIPGPFTPTHNMSSEAAPHIFEPSTSRQDSHPFTLCKISGNIKVCAGCRNKYPKSPSPPDDLCIKHQEWRELSQKVHRYRNIVLEMLTITSIPRV